MRRDPRRFETGMKFSRFEQLLGLSVLIIGLVAPFWNYFFPHSRFYDFNDAKRMMEKKVVHDHRQTIYCQAAFDSRKIIEPKAGLTVDGRVPGQLMMDWEHAAPVADFGRNFPEWTEGSPICARNGRQFKGRRCAALASGQFRRMEGDMYNLFPSINAVNQSRGNRRYASLPDAPPAFGSCGAKISRGRFEPPDEAKGPLARASLYMAATYEAYAPKPAQLALFEAWSRDFPVGKWECERTRRIERLQGNENRFVKEPCKKAGLW